MKREAEEPARHLLTSSLLVLELRNLGESIRNYDVFITGWFVVCPLHTILDYLPVPPRGLEF